MQDAPEQSEEADKNEKVDPTEDVSPLSRGKGRVFSLHRRFKTVATLRNCRAECNAKRP